MIGSWTCSASYILFIFIPGQVTIEIVLDAVKVPKEDEETEEENESESQPETQPPQLTSFSTRGLHKSYEDMTLLEGPDGAKSRTWRLREYPYDFDEMDDEDQIRGSFWTMCLPLFCRGKSKKHKHSKPPKSKMKKGKKRSSKKPETNLEPENYTERVKDRRGKVSPLMERTKKFQIESSHSDKSGPNTSNTFVRYAGDSGEIMLNSRPETLHRTDKNQNTSDHLTEKNTVKLKNNLNEVRTKQNGSVAQCVKNKTEPPIIIITKPEEDMTDTDSALPCEDDLDLSDSSETMVWKSDGLVYDGHVEKLFSSLDVTVRDGIVKYFEQDRGSLVLQIQCEQSLDIYNICMSQEQVENLQGDYKSGKLLKDLEDIILTQDYIHKMHFLDMRMKVVIKEEEFQLAIQDMT